MGEFGLIDHLTKGHENKNASTVYGVGDDCAVMHYPDKEVLVTTDMLMEGVHFDLTYIDLQHLGYKSAMVNISDIFAMNGTPRQMTGKHRPEQAFLGRGHGRILQRLAHGQAISLA